MFLFILAKLNYFFNYRSINSDLGYCVADILRSLAKYANELFSLRLEANNFI